MKRNIKLILLGSIFFISLIGVFSPIYVRGANTITYTILDDEIYNASSFSNQTIFNIRNTTEYGQEYNGTYTFYGEVGQTGTSIGFVDSETGYQGGTEVISELGYHDTVLQFQDDITVGENPLSKHDMTQSTSGTIEFWMRTNDNTEYWGINILEDATLCERFRINAGDIDYTDTSPAWQTIQPFSNNQWYHIRFEWKATNKFDGYIDGDLVCDDLALENNQVSGINGFQLYAGGDSADYCYLDAFGESWDSDYYMGFNTFPNYTETSNSEVALDEMAFDENGLQYSLGVIPDGDFVNGWEVDDSQSDVSIVAGLVDYDREVQIYSDTVHLRTLEKDLSLTTDGFINVSVNINYLDMNNDASVLYIGLYRTAVIECSLIRISYTGGNVELQKFDADGLGWTVLDVISSTTTLDRYLDLTVDSFSEMVVLRYRDNSSVDNIYTFPKSDTATNVYDSVSISSYMNDAIGTQTFHINSLGVSVNGSRGDYVGDYGINLIGLGVDNWDSKENNIININATGVFSFGAYAVGSFESIRGFSNHTGSHVYNTYNQSFDLDYPYVAVMSNQSFVFSNLSIAGVKLNDGTNNYSLGFSYSNVNIDESYFYADSSNNLRWSLFVDDNDTEYIQATFNIPDIASENRSFAFMSDLNGGSDGYVGVEYDDSDSTYIGMPIYATTQNLILPQTKIIETIEIIITDNDADDSDYTDGYVRDIQLIYYPDISISITTLSLVNVLIPLIIMLVPTLGIYIRWGKSTIVPVFLFMSLVCAVTNLIPYWLFFLILLAGGTFLFTKAKGGFGD